MLPSILLSIMRQPRECWHPFTMLTMVVHLCRQRQSRDNDEAAMKMLSSIRRVESTPNVEAAAIARSSRGGGGPWMSFTRKRRPRTDRKLSRSRLVCLQLPCLGNALAPSPPGITVKGARGRVSCSCSYAVLSVPHSL